MFFVWPLSLTPLSSDPGMLRRRGGLLLRVFQPDGVYPYRQPFYDTPYDGDRNPRDKQNPRGQAAYPTWMDHGIDGTGHGAGLHRSHPLSPLKDNTERTFESVPRMFTAMTMGINARNGATMYYRGGKPPNPSKHPYLTGEPCPVYGFRVLDHQVARHFEMPVVDKEKQKYKPYVAMQDYAILKQATAASADSAPGPVGGATGGAAPPAKGEKPMEQLKKRLFFWR